MRRLAGTTNFLGANLSFLPVNMAAQVGGSGRLGISWPLAGRDGACKGLPGGKQEGRRSLAGLLH
ncbi:hypothetical protein I5Q65_28925 [Pseudomonas aeruginosa]|uniref:hypothetical protein n=1 Tax=Pseudomonas aeruginosa TaxID=287 RepID=UPI0018C7A73A|nr:hypothetical protein [Pseudomonas aeruginosa]EKV8015565.1 hypothetical protein [Pseudomonas aeruginosa]EKX2800906.1 hypothetical protein [Pseudomonas aeruginosa]MBG5798867.1 hypothetical protein [Pseudomonas aeruginosa]MBH3773146.1 hypothetical protein [Pseudomonas aeruginosa]MBP8319984.1 hypothetical protein [Pseudomonas aeruginosa]